jgi:chorismate mutase
MVERFQFNSPFVIAGPCSAETEEQVLKIAHELKDSDVSVLEQEYGKEHVRRI